MTELIHDTDFDILHCFADVGVESEPLSAYGEVVRVGLNPRDTNDSQPVKADANALPFGDGVTFDLGLFHPPCQKWSTASRGRGDHPDLIPLARDIGERYAEHYIIENVPSAPLNQPVYLDGRMFGLPITYRRAFETSFHVEQPRMYNDLLAPDGPLADHQETGGWQGDERLWRSIKQVSGDYPTRDLKRSGIPAPYIHYLARAWVRATVDDEPDRSTGDQMHAR